MFLYANGAFSKKAGEGGKVRRNPRLRPNGVLSYVRQARADHSLSCLHKGGRGYSGRGTRLGAGRACDVLKPSTEYSIASLSRCKEGSRSGWLGRLTYRLASVPEIAPASRGSDSGSGCLRRRRRSFLL